ncbi:MAG: TlpA disulfide reductase family protein [Bdellovibrionota bacterium]
MRKYILGVLVTVVVVGIIVLAERSWRVNRPIPNVSQAEGQSLPIDIKFRSFPAKEEVSFEKFKGKVLVINFWASWCEACMAEMPSIQKLYDTLKSEGLEVLAINVDENPDKVVPHIVSKLGLSFPVFTDAGGELASAFEVVAIPFSVVTDREHKIVWSESGERDWASEGVMAEIRKLLKN